MTMFDWYEAETHCGIYRCAPAPRAEDCEEIILTLPWQCAELAEAIAAHLNATEAK